MNQEWQIPLRHRSLYLGAVIAIAGKERESERREETESASMYATVFIYVYGSGLRSLRSLLWADMAVEGTSEYMYMHHII